MVLATCRYRGVGSGQILPSHHDAEPLDFLEIKRFGVFLQFAAVSRVEAVPWNKDCAVFGVSWDGLRGQVEIAFPRDGGLLTAVFRVAGEEGVFQDESVSLLCCGNLGQSRSFSLKRVGGLSLRKGKAYCRPWRCRAECRHTRTSPSSCLHW